MIFFRFRNNPQIPTKKRVKDTPKILKRLIGIFSLFYATFDRLVVMVYTIGYVVGIKVPIRLKFSFLFVLNIFLLQY